jgi:DNA-binding response OmpR family regulator
MWRRATHAKILVAEDEPEILRFYKILLEDLGYQVFTAKDGQQCLEAYMASLNTTGGSKENLGFDLVILDHKIPRRNGMEVANEIASMAPSQKLLMVTAYAGVLDLTRKPVNMIIMKKPFDVDKLVSTIKELLSCPASYAQLKTPS